MRCEHEIAVGAYLLDALEPDEQLRMHEHVERCPVCADSVRELSGVANLLAGVEVDTLDLAEQTPPAPQPSEFAFQRLRSAATAAPAAAAPLAAPASRWRSWRALAVAAAAVVVVGGAAAGGVVALSAGGPPPATTLTAQAGGISAHAKVVAAGSGSLVTLTLDGVPVGEHCRLVAVARDGDRSSTHTWAVTRPGPLTWTDTVDVAPQELDHLQVVTADGRTLVTLPA